MRCCSTGAPGADRMSTSSLTMHLFPGTCRRTLWRVCSTQTSLPNLPFRSGVKTSLNFCGWRSKERPGMAGSSGTDTRAPACADSFDRKAHFPSSKTAWRVLSVLIKGSLLSISCVSYVACHLSLLRFFLVFLSVLQDAEAFQQHRPYFFFPA